MLTAFSVLHLVVMIVALAYLVVSIWAIIKTIRDGTLRTSDKVIWVAALVIVPLVTLVVWLVVQALKRRHKHRIVAS